MTTTEELKVENQKHPHNTWKWWFALVNNIDPKNKPNIILNYFHYNHKKKKKSASVFVLIYRFKVVVFVVFFFFFFLPFLFPFSSARLLVTQFSLFQQKSNTK